MKSKNYNFYLTTILILSSIGFIVFIGFKLYESLKGSINDDNGYNSIDSVVGILSLILSIITVISIFITYQSQQKQLKDNNIDTEYNRALEIVYKQLEYTDKRFNPVNNPISGIYSNYIQKPVRLINLDKNDVHAYQLLRKQTKGILQILGFFIKEFQLYKDILNVEGIDYDSRLKLINIITWNISPYFKTDIIDFKNIYEDLVNAEIEIIKQNNTEDDTNKVLYRLNEIISFLNAKF